TCPASGGPAGGYPPPPRPGGSVRPVAGHPPGRRGTVGPAQTGPGPPGPPHPSPGPLGSCTALCPPAMLEAPASPPGPWPAAGLVAHPGPCLSRQRQYTPIADCCQQGLWTCLPENRQVVDVVRASPAAGPRATIHRAEGGHGLRLVTGAGIAKQGANELVAAVGLDPGFQVGLHAQLIPAIKLGLGVWDD